MSILSNRFFPRDDCACDRVSSSYRKYTHTNGDCSHVWVVASKRWQKKLVITKIGNRYYVALTASQNAHDEVTMRLGEMSLVTLNEYTNPRRSYPILSAILELDKKLGAPFEKVLDSAREFACIWGI